MTSSPTAAEILERNKSYAPNHSPLPYIGEWESFGVSPPKTFIVTCSDPRCIPETFMNLHYGEVLVARNAGGHASYALRDIVAIDSLLNLQDLIVIHHTDCGTTHYTDEAIRAALNERAPGHQKEIQQMTFGEIKDLEESVKANVKFVKESPFIRKELRDRAQGFLFDIKTGEVKKIA